jgi:hypothetical protein
MKTLFKTPEKPAIPAIADKLKVTRVEIVHSRKYVFGIVVAEHIYTYTAILRRKRQPGGMVTERHAAYCVLAEVFNNPHVSDYFDLSLLDDEKINVYI